MEAGITFIMIGVVFMCAGVLVASVASPAEGPEGDDTLLRPAAMGIGGVGALIFSAGAVLMIVAYLNRW